MGWPVKSSFVRYVASSGGTCAVEPGADFSSDWGLVFDPEAQDVSRETGEGILAFSGAVTFSAHMGMLRVRLAHPTLTLSGGEGMIVIEHGSAQTRPLANFRYAYSCTDVDARWELVDVRLAPDAVSLFGDVYEAGEPLDSIMVRLLN